MANKNMNPATRADAGRARNSSVCLAAMDSFELTPTASEIQQRRAIWIARRANISIVLADVIAALAFGTEAAQ